MEEDAPAADKAPAVLPDAAKPLPAAAPIAADPTAPLQPQVAPVHAGGGRQLFSVELRPGETTIVSWKKLVKEAGRASGSPSKVASEQPSAVAIAGQAGTSKSGEEQKEPDAPNRFSAVIEKIERLYMGKHSSDEEELDDTPDDDQYDTEDSFIDDAELDEYFEVDNMRTKHDGYFVNKGKLEQIEPGKSQSVEPKKRRRKDSVNSNYEKNMDLVPHDYTLKMEKASARSAFSAGKKQMHNDIAVKHKNGPPIRNYTKSSDHTQSLNQPAFSRAVTKDGLLAPIEHKDSEKHRAGASRQVDSSHRSRITSDYPYGDATYQDNSVPVDYQSKKSHNVEESALNNIRPKEKYATAHIAEQSTSGAVYPVQALQSTSNRVRDGSAFKPRGSRLERAIRDLEKMVAEYRPPALEIQEVELGGQGAKKRLPQEVKLKLSKVARLSASQGKISEEEMIDRLMGILGHLVHRKTLKRNLREMVESGISANQEKANRFQLLKKEINEMVAIRVSSIKSKMNEHQDGSADDFQGVAGNDERIGFRGKTLMDAALEDKMYELYDLYVEGMEEDKGPQSRKLYVELAEMWPAGYMDKVGIKDAICRGRDRKRALYNQRKVRSEERIKRKQLVSATYAGHVGPTSNFNHAGQTGSIDRPVLNQPPASSFPPADHGQYEGIKMTNKGRDFGMYPTYPNANPVKVKKKRKLEMEPRELQRADNKQYIKEKHKSNHTTDEPAGGSSHASKTIMPVLGLPSYYDHPS